MKHIKAMILAGVFTISMFLSPAWGEEWQISGHLTDVCSCNVGCPCSFGSPPTQGFCKKLLLFDIVNGKHGDTNLSGLKFVAAAELGSWISYYVDENASTDQKKALENVFNEALKGLAKEFLGTKYVNINTHYEKNTRGGDIPNILNLKVESVMGLDGKTPIVVVNPKSRPTIPEFTVGRSISHNFKDHGKDWDYSGKSGYYGEFKYSSEMMKKKGVEK